MKHILPFVIACLGITAIPLAQSSASRQPPHFTARGDDGTVIHILPPPTQWSIDRQTAMAAVAQPTPRVFPAPYGTGKLINHGGPEMPDASFFAIYWNRAVANSRQTSLGFSTLRQQMGTFVNAFSDDHHYDRSPTDDYTIVQQYSVREHISAPLPYFGSFVDNRSAVGSVPDSMVRRYLTTLFSTGKVYAARNIIYGVFLPSGSTASLNDGEESCFDFCGYHSAFVFGGMWIKYVVLPYPDCDACSMAGMRVADILTIVLGHEIRETVTDPRDNGEPAWFDADGLEADDKCAWFHLYRMTNGGFWVQPEFSNGGRGGSTGVLYPGPGCVVPR